MRGLRTETQTENYLCFDFDLNTSHMYYAEVERDALRDLKYIHSLDVFNSNQIIKLIFNQRLLGIVVLTD